MAENEITDDILRQAMELRRKGLYTMREISEKLGVNREELIAAIKAIPYGLAEALAAQEEDGA